MNENWLSAVRARRVLLVVLGQARYIGRGQDDAYFAHGHVIHMDFPRSARVLHDRHLITRYKYAVLGTALSECKKIDVCVPQGRTYPNSVARSSSQITRLTN